MYLLIDDQNNVIPYKFNETKDPGYLALTNGSTEIEMHNNDHLLIRILTPYQRMMIMARYEKPDFIQVYDTIHGPLTPENLKGNVIYGQLAAKFKPENYNEFAHSIPR